MQPLVITEVSLKLAGEDRPGGRHQVLAYVNVTYAGQLAVRGIRLMQRPDGVRFLAFPETPLKDRCPGCHQKNVLKARYCTWCGKPLPPAKIALDSRGREVLFEHAAHPLTVESREATTDAVMAAYAIAVTEPAPPLNGWQMFPGNLPRPEVKELTP